MTHDPMCPAIADPKAFWPCRCDLIARIREEYESQDCYTLGLAHGIAKGRADALAEVRQPGRVTLAVEDAYAKGRADALAEARDAVADVAFVRPAYYGKGVLIRGAEPDMVRQDALAAIDGLRGDA